MSSNLLKIIALICMLIDHIGAFLLPECNTLFRIIGRIAFPIFCFSLAQGFLKTSNFKKYALRLAFWALIAQIPYSLLLGKRGSVILTLLIGLLCLKLYDYSTSSNPDLNPKLKSYSGLIVVGLIILSDLLRCDYGSYGIVTIFIFYKYLKPNAKEKHSNSGFSKYINNNKKSLVITISSLNLIMCLISALSTLNLQNFFNLQLYSLLALPLILNCNNKKGKFKLKYLFYIFYPVHLSIIYVIKYYILNASYKSSYSYYNIMLIFIYPILYFILAAILNISIKNKLYPFLIEASIFIYLYFDCKNFSSDIKYQLVLIATFVVGNIIFYYKDFINKKETL